MGRERDYAEGNLTGEEATGAFLEAFRDMVLPALEWTDAIAGIRSRAVKLSHVRDVLDPLLIEAWEREMKKRAHEHDERVHLDTGAEFSP